MNSRFVLSLQVIDLLGDFLNALHNDFVVYGYFIHFIHINIVVFDFVHIDIFSFRFWFPYITH